MSLIQARRSVPALKPIVSPGDAAQVAQILPHILLVTAASGTSLSVSSATAVRALTAERHDFPVTTRGRAHSRLNTGFGGRDMFADMFADGNRTDRRIERSMERCHSSEHLVALTNDIEGTNQAIRSSVELLRRTATSYGSHV